MHSTSDTPYLTSAQWAAVISFIGAKLTNAYSKFFSIETIDGPRKLKFYQEEKNIIMERRSLNKYKDNNGTYRTMNLLL